MPSHRLAGVILFVSFLLFTLQPESVHAQRGALTLPRNVAELTSKADTIVRGRVLYALVERHPEYRNINTVVVTLAVHDVLKGSSGKTLTFRQFIWDPRDVADQSGFRRGQDFVLFLNAPTAAGLTSPVGLEQGKFKVIRDSKGAEMAVNGHQNTTLFRGVAKLGPVTKMSTGARNLITRFEQRPGPVPLEILLGSVHAFLGERGVRQ
jgi:hypothetical protein